MESLAYVFVKVVIGIIIITIILNLIFYILHTAELERICTNIQVDNLYEEIDPGDILIVRMTSMPERVLTTTIAEFSHYILVVKLPDDNNKYILHTKNEGIKPLLYPELPHNVEIHGRKNNYQLVELREYLSYIQHKDKYIVHLKTHQKHDYTINIKELYKLKCWKGYTRRNCGYLLLDYLKNQGWSQQIRNYSRDRAYYCPVAIKLRLLRDDNYTHEGTYKLY